MKRNLLAATVLATLSSGVFATTTDTLKVDFIGEAAIGGEVKLDDTQYVDKSKIDAGFTASYGDFYGMVFAESFTTTAPGHGHGVDGYDVIVNRAYLGYHVDPELSVQIGAQDSALDLQDGYGDFTVEYGANAAEMDDAKFAIAAYDNVGDTKWGVSVSAEGKGYTGAESGWSEPSAINGYVLQKVGGVEIMGGAELQSGETLEGNKQIIVMTGIKGDFVGARVWHDTAMDQTGAAASVGGKLSETFYIGGGYNHIVQDKADDVSYANVGFIYNFSEKTLLKFDTKFDMSDEEDHSVWFRQTYVF